MARLAGEQDEDVKHWRARVDEYTRLHNALLPLDSVDQRRLSMRIPAAERTSPSSSASRASRSGAGPPSCSASPTSGRCSGAARPPGAAAGRRRRASVTALIAEVGDKDLEAKRWSVKVAARHGAGHRPGGELKGAYVLPPPGAQAEQ
jgi:hypothetical protein